MSKEEMPTLGEHTEKIDVSDMPTQEMPSPVSELRRENGKIEKGTTEIPAQRAPREARVVQRSAEKRAEALKERAEESARAYGGLWKEDHGWSMVDPKDTKKEKSPFIREKEELQAKIAEQQVNLDQLAEQKIVFFRKGKEKRFESAKAEFEQQLQALKEKAGATEKEATKLLGDFSDALVNYWAALKEASKSNKEISAIVYREFPYAIGMLGSGQEPQGFFITDPNLLVKTLNV